MTGKGHLLAEHLVALFLAQVLLILCSCGVLVLFTLGCLVLLLGQGVVFSCGDLVKNVTGNGALDVVEFLKTIQCDHTLHINRLIFV